MKISNWPLLLIAVSILAFAVLPVKYSQTTGGCPYGMPHSTLQIQVDNCLNVSITDHYYPLAVSWYKEQGSTGQSSINHNSVWATAIASLLIGAASGFYFNRSHNSKQKK